MNQVITFVVVCAILAALLAGRLWFIPWADRRRIKRMIERDGARVLAIERAVSLRALASENNATFWRVVYVAPAGQKRVATCFASFLRCRIYNDVPADPDQLPT